MDSSALNRTSDVDPGIRRSAQRDECEDWQSGDKPSHYGQIETVSTNDEYLIVKRHEK